MTTKIAVALVIAVALAAALVVTGRESVKATEIFQINLDPATAENVIFENHTVTATVTDNLDYLPPGILVTFTVISGPNIGAGGTCTANPDCTTDGIGEVSFTYTSAGGVGTDLIQACFTDALYGVECSDPVTKDWVLPPPLEVDIDIKPKKEVNSINPGSGGLIPVAILGSETFDVTDVDVTTLAFGAPPCCPGPAHDGHLQDVNDDGLTDLVLHFRTQETGIEAGNTLACLTGETFDGVPFEACDDIRTVPPGAVNG